MLITKTVASSLNKKAIYRDLGRRAGRLESERLREHLEQTLRSGDYEFIVEHANLVVDTRNATKQIVENREKICKA